MIISEILQFSEMSMNIKRFITLFLLTACLVFASTMFSIEVSQANAGGGLGQPFP